jgi:hypothetical protein
MHKTASIDLCKTAGVSPPRLKIWHYTVPEALCLIEVSGFLQPSYLNSKKYPSKPIVWCSANQNWEPTAGKRLGEVQITTLAKMLEVFGSLYRFGVDESDVIPWTELQRRAQIVPLVANLLEKTAIQIDSNPSDWCGSLWKIFRHDWVTVQKLTVDTDWRDIDITQEVSQLLAKT